MIIRKTVYAFLLFLILNTYMNVSLAGQYNLFGRFIPEGTPTVDGVISSGEWDEIGHITLYKFFGEDSKIEIYLMWDSTNLYVGADIQDYELWIDSFNSSQPWVSTWDDDAFKIEIDPDYSQDEILQTSDRVFAINADGSGSRFDAGDGSGSTIAATEHDSIAKAVTYSGTLNDFTFKTLSNESQKDVGFTVEVAISWRNIMGSTPPDNHSMGMNFTNLEDDTGGTLDAAYYPEWKRVFDELTKYMGEETYPENWAEFITSSKSDTTAPSALSNLNVTGTNAYSANISFTSTGDNSASGYANEYEIRYSTSPITEANWSSASEYKNNFRPQKAGSTENFKLIGFQPDTSYSLGIKAKDERENASSLVTTSFTTSSASSTSDKGYLTVGPSQRYFARENGEPFIAIGDNQGMAWPLGLRSFYNGPMWDNTFGFSVNWFQVEGPETGRQLLQDLADHGVNTIRTMAESYDLDNPAYLYTDVSAGANNIVFNDATLDYLETLLDECASYDINVVLFPFDTFYYKDKWSEVPLSTSKGGPMPTQDDFFNIEHIDYLKAILSKLVERLGDKKNLLAWEIVNEPDSDDPDTGWNRAEFSDREEVVNALIDHLRAIDPNHMIFFSSVRWDPRFTNHITDPGFIPAPGADAAFVLNNIRTDFSSIHTYFPDIRAPNYNHPDNLVGPFYTYEVYDLDNTISPAVGIKQGIQFYYANSLIPKPYFGTEHGPLPFWTSHYDQFFSETTDYQYFHNMIWAHLASGDVGSGLRWPGDMFRDFVSHNLRPQMRDYQLALTNFIAEDLDFYNFQPIQIGQYMSISNITLPIVKTGITDGDQGIIFLVNDERKQTNGTISGAILTIPKLTSFNTYSVEFWNTYDETATSASSTTSVTADSSGSASVTLPSFAKTQTIKFYKTGTATTPVAAITANSSGSSVSINAGDQLSIAISLSSGSYSGSNADWWLVTSTPSGEFEHYDLSQGDFTSSLLVTYQGALFDLGDYAVPIDTSGFATGTYTYYFGIDLNQNGSVDFDQLYYDSVVVNITP